MGSRAISSLPIRPPPQKVACRARARDLTSEVFEGPEGFEAQGVRGVSEQYRPLRTWGSIRNKREPPTALKKLFIKKLGVLFFT